MLLEKAARAFGVDLERFKNSAKVSGQDVLDRDLLLYLVWLHGHQTNQQIADLFGLSYSAVSRRISIFKQLILRDNQVKKRLEPVKSIIKI